MASAPPTSPEKSSPSFDSFGNVPEYGPLREAVASRDWVRADAAFAELDASDQSYAMLLLAEVDDIEAALEDAVAQMPSSASLRTALAMRRIMLGWFARSAAPADHVSPAAMTSFRELLVSAEQLLIAVCADSPDYAPCWAARVITARGLEVAPSEARRRYAHLVSRNADDFTGQTQMLQYLLPKWFGSVDEARDFVRTAIEAAPAGSNAGALTAIQHIERWAELDGGKPGSKYILRESVRAELRDAAARSVLHPDHVSGALSVQAHSAFALAFYLADGKQDAAVHLRALGDRATEFPWNIAGVTAPMLRDIRTELLATEGAVA